MNAEEHVVAPGEIADLEILTTEQYAALRGVSVYAIYAERRRGTGPAYIRLGDPLTGRVYYKRSEILEHDRQRWERKARSCREEAEQHPELADRRAELAERAYRNLSKHWARRRGQKSPE